MEGFVKINIWFGGFTLQISPFFAFTVVGLQWFMGFS